MRSITTMAGITLVVAGLTASVAEQGAAQAKETWWEFTTGINHNGKDWLGRDPIYFAEIRLRIPLSRDDLDWVKDHATPDSLPRLKQFLSGKLPDTVSTASFFFLIRR